MIDIKECDFTDPLDRRAVIDLMNHYMADPMGDERPPYTEDIAEKVVNGLQEHPSSLVLLAKYNDNYAGLVTGFINFATFTAKPFINIHDIVVLRRYRGSGIGRKLMEAVDLKARELDCGKITLEVRSDNKTAQALYKSTGYDECTPVMHFWTRNL